MGAGDGWEGMELELAAAFVAGVLRESVSRGRLHCRRLPRLAAAGPRLETATAASSNLANLIQAKHSRKKTATTTKHGLMLLAPLADGSEGNV